MLEGRVMAVDTTEWTSGPVLAPVGQQLARLANEVGVAMEHASASESGALCNFAEVVLVFKNLMLKFIHILNMSSICTKCMV
jgi:hypothetical protein